MKHEVEDMGSSAVAERSGSARKTGPAKSDAENQEIQKKMEALGTPGPAHKALEAFIGSWKAEVKCWYEKDGPPEITQATAKNRWILNGRFLEEEFHGEMMGKPFTGRTIIGYDNFRQAFNMVWISDIQTAMFCSEGKGEQGNKVITLEGKADCPATGRKNIIIKSVFRVLSPDKHVFEMHDTDEGRKTMEITYTRT
jgi:hypothetical protein